jgi:phage terminase small subunit
MSRDAKRCNVDAADTKVAQLYPPCPNYLQGAAGLLWGDVARKLVQEGDWDPHDSEAVAALYCVHAAMLAAAIENITTQGPITEAAVTGVPQHNPWRKVLSEASEGLLKFGEMLNLTPPSRAYRQQRKRVFDATGRWPV